MRRLAFLGLLALLAAPVAAQDLPRAREQVRALEGEIEELVARVGPAVGAVSNWAPAFHEPSGKVTVQPRGMGSGLVVTREGLLLTNVHVVQDAGYLTVALPDGGTYPAEVVADTSTGLVKGDIAVLQLRGKDRWPFVDWSKGESGRLAPGSFVFAMGNPYGHAMDGTPVVTMGIVSGQGRAAAETGFLYVDAIQTDAEINPGNSGGPLFDIEGRFIGINGLMASRQAMSNSGVGFAIPVDQVQAFMKQLLKGGGTDVGYGFHGLTVDSAPDESGALVTRVEPGSPADEAGLKRDDVVFKTKGKLVRNRTDFVNTVAKLPEGAVVSVLYRRGSNTKTAKFRLVSFAAWKERHAPAQAPQPLALAARGWLGAEWRQARDGLVLERIVPGAAAERAGLRPQDKVLAVDEAPIPDAKALAAQLALRPKGAKVKLAYEREGRRKEIDVVLSDVAEAAGLER